MQAKAASRREPRSLSEVLVDSDIDNQIQINALSKVWNHNVFNAVMSSRL